MQLDEVVPLLDARARPAPRETEPKVETAAELWPIRPADAIWIAAGLLAARLLMAWG